MSQDLLIHGLFEHQAQRTPDAVAVVYEQRSLTYAELNGRANQLARYLRARGIGPNHLVALCLERSVEMVVGIIGILKAGAAYVPLDPSYPSERLAHMLDDAAPRVVLTQDKLANSPLLTSASSVALDSQWHEIAGQSSDNLEPHARSTARDLAYVIYTSGSTGTPKGVMVEHGNVLNLWRALSSACGPAAPGRRVGLNASLTFDASVQQWVQLLSGCALFVIPQQLRLHPRMLLNFVDRHRIEMIDCTPSQLKAWLAAGLLQKYGSTLRTVLVGGEAIDAALWGRLVRSPDVAFYNVYGPTECTVDSTFARLSDASTEPHIGRPLENTRVYLLDDSLSPVTLGESGEIYIGGAGVARGYMNRPALTAERFIADPFSQDPRERLYKTGDLGRWRPDGNIEYLGRGDQQVKIRGCRIELGEIEAQLLRHARVRQAAVIAQENGLGEKRLIAHVVADASPGSGTTLRGEELRAHLQAALPEYMVPSAFVVLDRLPLTPSGKLDRRALQATNPSVGTSQGPVGDTTHEQPDHGKPASRRIHL